MSDIINKTSASATLVLSPEETARHEEELKSKKLLFMGINYFMKRLIKSFSVDHHCVVVAETHAVIPEFDDNKNISLYNGDVNSIVLWKKLPLNDVSHLIFSVFELQDNDVVEELCRTAREIFKLDALLIGLCDRNNIPAFFEKYNVVPVDPVAVGVRVTMGLVDTNYAIPANIGLGKGEIVEVTIFRRSHLVDRKLRYMESSRWQVAAIYREGELVIPEGDSEMRVGDRVVLVGEPAMLSNIVNILMQGVPQFPFQFGNQVSVVINDRTINPLEEANYFNRYIMTRMFSVFTKKGDKYRIEKNEIASSMDIKSVNEITSYKNSVVFSGAGLVIVSAPKRFNLFNLRMRYFIRKCPSPLLLAKGGFPYSCIIVSLNCNSPAQVLQVSLEIAEQFTLPVKIIYSALPKALRNAKLENELDFRNKIVKEYESIERKKVEYTVLEGNPVRTSLEYQRNFSRPLFIIGNNIEQKIKLFEPHIPYIIAEKIPCSVLFIPEIKG